MKEKSKEYYDQIFSKAPQYSLETDADHSWHKDLYDFVITLFDKYDEILELGCGTGQFAEKMILNNLNYKYGIDFSEIGISLCNQRCPQAYFYCYDLYKLDFNDLSFNTILSLEVMEHIEGDLEILSRIKPGTKVIISVPSFDDPAHVRFFKDKDDVYDRYKGIFQTLMVHQVNRYFVIEAIK
jgi:SAM-dependent methyltransferase